MMFFCGLFGAFAITCAAIGLTITREPGYEMASVPFFVGAVSCGAAAVVIGVFA